MSNEKEVGISTKDLVTLIKTIIEETRKPTEYEQVILSEKKKALEKEQQDILEANAEREQYAALQKQEEEQKRINQKVCTHKHKLDGRSHLVFVQDDLGGYVLCQKCQVIVRPGVAPEGYTGHIVYDNAKFNEFVQYTTASPIID